jgi:hypothetical protein
MRYAWLLIAVFAARFFVTSVAYPQLDGDISWQRWLGFEILRSGSVPHALGAETFTAAGAPWLPHEWLFSIAAALGSGGLGWTIFSGAVALCAVGALALAALEAERRGASPKAVALCTVVAGIALFESFGVRAQVVAWPLLVGFLMLLECEGPLAWAALIVAALWSNVHGSAALAPALATLVAIGAWLDTRRFTPRVRRLFAIAVASLGAICLNPLGWKLPAYSLMLLRNPSIRANIIEWKITGLEDPSFAYGAFALLLAAVVIGIARSYDLRVIRWERLFVFVAFCWLMLGAARNIALFALVALPTVAAALSEVVPWFARDPRDDENDRFAWIPRFGLPALAMSMSFVVAALLVHGESASRDNLADPALAALARQPGAHRVLCTDFAWCGLLVGKPNVRVFLDGRADPYPERVWNDYLEIARLRPQWQQKLADYRVDAIVAGRDVPLDQALAAAGGWRAAYADKRYRLWLRSGAAQLGAVHQTQRRT